jgi:hypothetical protein
MVSAGALESSSLGVDGIYLSYESDSAITNLELKYMPWIYGLEMSGLVGDVRIPPFAFRWMAKVQEVIFPRGLVDIGESSFEGCGLRAVDLSQTKVRRVGKRAFASCITVGELLWPEGVEEISEGSFMWVGVPSKDLRWSRFDMLGGRVRPCECLVRLNKAAKGDSSVSRLSTVDLSGTRLRRIESEAFRVCVNVRVVRVPATLEEVGDSGFSGTLIEKVRLAHCRRLRKVGRLAFSTHRLRKVALPPGLVVVGERAFARAWNPRWGDGRAQGGVTVDAGCRFDLGVFRGALLHRTTLRGASLLSCGGGTRVGELVEPSGVMFSGLVGL